MTHLEVLLTFISGLFSIGLGGMGVLFYRQTKRTKTAEAFSAEVNALKGAIDAMKEELDRMRARIKDLETTEGVLRREKDVLEVKHAKNKSAINQAHSCEYANACPVLKRREENEEEYARQVSKRAERNG